MDYIYIYFSRKYVDIILHYNNIINIKIALIEKEKFETTTITTNTKQNTSIIGFQKFTITPILMSLVVMPGSLLMIITQMVN